MQPLKSADMEPIPGYRLLSPLGSGGFGEVWKCEAPGGLYKAIKFVYGRLNGLEAEGMAAREELRAIQHVKRIRHPFLLSMERVELVNDELIIVMELADQSLEDVLVAHQSAGRAGAPRDEVLRYLQETAEVLDMLHLEHGLQHLDVKPRNVFLVRNHVKVADFGLVQSLNQSLPVPAEHSPDQISLSLGSSSMVDSQEITPGQLSAISPLYAAPELFQGIVTPHSDQYSLAIVFQELLTGCLPFNGQNVRQLMLQHALEKPCLATLPEADRAVISKALSKDPKQRFTTCMELVAALQGADSTTMTSRAMTADNAGALRADENAAKSPPPRPKQSKYLPEYELLNCRQRTPLLENWEAKSPTGETKIVQFTYGMGTGRRERDAVDLLQRMRHVCLADRQVRMGGADCLLLVNELIEDNLHARYQEHLKQGLRGIPRDELLEILATVAATLDRLARQYRVQHLELSPRNVLLSGSQPKIADFGLAQLLWLPMGHPASKASARYSAPELSERRISHSCDQYSLAMIYEEMLTGYHAYRGRFAKAPSCNVHVAKSRDAARKNGDGEPNLKPLSKADRRILARALHHDPSQRFAGCTELIQALLDAGTCSQSVVDSAVKAAHHSNGIQAAPSNNGNIGRIADLVASMQSTPADAAEPSFSSTPTFIDEDCLEGRLIADLPSSGALVKFEGFRSQWDAEVVRAQSTSVAFRIVQSTKKWLPWSRRAQGLLVEVTWGSSVSRHSTSPEVAVQVRPLKKRVAERALLHDLGHELVASLQAHLKGQDERRTRDRVFWPHPVQVQFLLNDQPVGDGVECQGKDLSPTGIGFYLPGKVPSSQVRVRLSNDALPQSIDVRGSVVRVQRYGSDLFEVGARFDAP